MKILCEKEEVSMETLSRFTGLTIHEINHKIKNAVDGSMLIDGYVYDIEYPVLKKYKPYKKRAAKEKPVKRECLQVKLEYKILETKPEVISKRSKMRRYYIDGTQDTTQSIANTLKCDLSTFRNMMSKAAKVECRGHIVHSVIIEKVIPIAKHRNPAPKVENIISVSEKFKTHLKRYHYLGQEISREDLSAMLKLPISTIIAKTPYMSSCTLNGYDLEITYHRPVRLYFYNVYKDGKKFEKKTAEEAAKIMSIHYQTVLAMSRSGYYTRSGYKVEKWTK